MPPWGTRLRGLQPHWVPPRPQIHLWDVWESSGIGPYRLRGHSGLRLCPEAGRRWTLPAAGGRLRNGLSRSYLGRLCLGRGDGHRSFGFCLGLLPPPRAAELGKEGARQRKGSSAPHPGQKVLFLLIWQMVLLRVPKERGCLPRVGEVETRGKGCL